MQANKKINLKEGTMKMIFVHIVTRNVERETNKDCIQRIRHIIREFNICTG